MIPYEKLNKIPYGGDYNPEQWPEENTYDFSKLDAIMELVKENGLKVCMATSTGAHPAWMAKRYPDILRVVVVWQRKT